MPGTTLYTFTGEIWQHAGPGGWFFVSLPINTSTTIRANCKDEEEGWGRLKVKVTIGNTTWQTAIWFDTKRNCYLLPLKAEVRKKEKLTHGRAVKVGISV